MGCMAHHIWHVHPEVHLIFESAARDRCPSHYCPEPSHDVHTSHNVLLFVCLTSSRGAAGITVVHSPQQQSLRKLVHQTLKPKPYCLRQTCLTRLCLVGQSLVCSRYQVLWDGGAGGKKAQVSNHRDRSAADGNVNRG